MRFRRSFLLNLLLFGFSILLFVFCAEVFLRLVKPQNFDVHAPGMYVADPSIGYVLKPGFAGIIGRPLRSTRPGSAVRRRGPGQRTPFEFSFLAILWRLDLACSTTRPFPCSSKTCSPVISELGCPSSERQRNGLWHGRRIGFPQIQRRGA